MCNIHPAGISMNKIDSIRSIIVKALDGITGLIQNMRPTLLDDLGLVPAIKSLLDVHLGARNINYFFNTSGVADKRFRPELEITLFRIIQEAVVNIARHSKATNVFVLFTIENKTVNVEVEDDGEGFELKKLFHAGAYDTVDLRGLGLLGMKERVALIGGKIEVCSQPGLGTRVDIRIPLTEREVLRA
jgi:signal transduction histidine kinase